MTPAEAKATADLIARIRAAEIAAGREPPPEYDARLPMDRTAGRLGLGTYELMRLRGD